MFCEICDLGNLILRIEVITSFFLVWIPLITYNVCVGLVLHLDTLNNTLGRSPLDEGSAGRMDNADFNSTQH